MNPETLEGACGRAQSSAPESNASATYDEFLKLSPQRSIFATRWWLDAVAPNAYEILEVRRGKNIRAAWPIVFSWRNGVRHIQMPPLTQKLGIMFPPSIGKTVEVQSTNQELSNALLDRLGECGSFQQNFHEAFTDWLPFYWRGYAQSTRYTYVLEDISDINSLWNEMRPHHRRVIRKSEKLGIRIRDDIELSTFLDLNRQTFVRQGKEPLATDEFITRLDAACCDNSARKIFAGVDSRGVVHAAVYIAWFDDTAYYLMGGGDPRLRDSGAQILALWEAVKFAGTVAKRFDFEGSMLQQVERVFRGFGAAQRSYFSLTKRPPPPESLREFLIEAVRFRVNRLRKAITHKPAARSAMHVALACNSTTTSLATSPISAISTSRAS